jgi:hypothetical protein
MCNQNIQLSANNGNVNISTANSNLDGSGALGTVLTAASGGNSGGTFIRSVTLKATGNTSLGMLRVFVSNGTNTYLLWEIIVPANDQTGVVPAFYCTINESFTLQAGYILYASTQNAESFNIIANGQDITNCGCQW